MFPATVSSIRLKSLNKLFKEVLISQFFYFASLLKWGTPFLLAHSK
jgi:hypothetical protein